MNEAVQIIGGILLVIVVFVLSNKFQGWKVGKAFRFIVQDLRNQGATDSESSVHLPYATKSIFKMGLKDYRPKTLNYMVMEGIVSGTPDGRFFLNEEKLRDTPFAE